MYELEGKTLISRKDATDLLGISPAALYQLVARNKLTKYRPNNGKIFLVLEEIRYFRANKKGLPLFEDLPEQTKISEEFFEFEYARRLLGYTKEYLLQLLKQGDIKGYCDVMGQIHILKSSFDSFLAVQKPHGTTHTPDTAKDDL